METLAIKLIILIGFFALQIIDVLNDKTVVPDSLEAPVPYVLPHGPLASGSADDAY